MNESKTIPRWIIIYGYIMALLGIGFGVFFFIDSNPAVAMDLGWMISVRNVAILAILLIGLIRLDTKLLFAGYLLRFIVELGDMTNQFLAGELMAGLIFIPFFLVPQAYGAWTLWKIARAE